MVAQSPVAGEPLPVAPPTLLSLMEVKWIGWPTVACAFKTALLKKKLTLGENLTITPGAMFSRAPVTVKLEVTRRGLSDKVQVVSVVISPPTVSAKAGRDANRMSKPNTHETTRPWGTASGHRPIHSWLAFTGIAVAGWGCSIAGVCSIFRVGPSYSPQVQTSHNLDRWGLV